jgi:hypothetical protein
MQFHNIPLALCLAAGLAVGAPSLMAQGKKAGKGKSASHQVINRGSSPSVRASTGRGNNQRHMAAARRAGGMTSRPIATARGKSDGNTTRRPSSTALANSSPRKIDRHVVSSPRRGLSNRPGIGRSQLASPARSEDNSRVMRASRANRIDRGDRIDRQSTAIASSRNPRLRSSEITRHDRRDRDGDRHRDRSSYRQRHEHHSSDWYRSHGWRYDHDYYQSHRHHRYYNDALGVFIIDNFGPTYSYGYSEPVYLNTYDVDYATRLAVQEALAEAGYYNGPLDGIIGPGTRSAISRYQADAGLIVTGMIDDSLMRSLALY